MVNRCITFVSPESVIFSRKTEHSDSAPSRNRMAHVPGGTSATISQSSTTFVVSARISAGAGGLSCICRNRREGERRRRGS